MNTITPLTAIPALSSTQPRQGGQQAPPAALQAEGELIRALVLEKQAADRYLLDIGGNRIPASSRAPLSPGQQLQLQVVSTSPQVELKIVTDVFTSLSGKSLVLLGNSLDISALLTSLTQAGTSVLNQLTEASRETLRTYQPANPQDIIASKQGGEFLKTLFNRLGLNLERLLAEGNRDVPPRSLKAALLEIAAQLKGSERIAEQANRLLATIEIFQLAQLQLSQDRFILFPLPLPFVEQGYLLVDKHKRGKGEEHGDERSDEFRYSLHLSLSAIGFVKVLFYQSDNQLYLKIALDSQEKADFAAQFEDTLHETLSSVNLASVSFSADAGDPAAELVRLLVPREQSILDTTI